MSKDIDDMLGELENKYKKTTKPKEEKPTEPAEASEYDMDVPNDKPLPSASPKIEEPLPSKPSSSMNFDLPKAINAEPSLMKPSQLLASKYQKEPEPNLVKPSQFFSAKKKEEDGVEPSLVRPSQRLAASAHKEPEPTFKKSSQFFGNKSQETGPEPTFVRPSQIASSKGTKETEPGSPKPTSFFGGKSNDPFSAQSYATKQTQSYHFKTADSSAPKSPETVLDVKQPEKPVENSTPKPVEPGTAKTATEATQKPSEPVKEKAPKSEGSLVKVSELLSGAGTPDKSTPKVAENTPIRPPENASEYTVVLDIGEGSTKIGFTTDTKPFVFETITGSPKFKNLMADVSGMVQNIYVGDDCTRMRGVLKIDHPINRGNVMDWNAYYAILNHIFYNVLRVDPTKCNVIYLVHPLTTPDIAQYYARVLFETHKVKSVAILDTASASLFSTGETTALTVEMGAGLTHVVPIINGQTYISSIQRLPLAGVDVEEYLNRLMSTYGQNQKREIMKEIKEQVVEIPLDANLASRDPKYNRNFILPDGSSLPLSAYVIAFSGEPLFNPSLLGYNVNSLQQSVMNSIRLIEPKYWRILLQKIVLVGGGALLKGLPQRLEQEIDRLLPQLGPLPAIEVETPAPAPIEKKEVDPNKLLFGEPKKEEKEMVQIGDTKSKSDLTNCPKCGELINPSESKFCPFCGGEVTVTQIDILGSKKQKYPEKCPKCGKKLDGESKFCSECGESLKSIIVDEKLDRKEEKLIKKTAVSEKELKVMEKAVESEYGTEEDLKDLEAIDKKGEEAKAIADKKVQDAAKVGLKFDPNKIINVISIDGQKYPAFKGASILGNLPSFKKFLIDYATFSQNPNTVVIDISKVINNN